MPTVTTSSVSSILTTTAQSGGNVTAWGGDTVSVKGICWSENENPTIIDNKSEDGTGEGQFLSALTGLSPNTKYYVRAYAVNSIGTGYGNQVQFTTQTPQPDVKKIVAQDGTGNYTSVQTAFDDVPNNYTGHWIIYVKNGTYYEQLNLGANKINVILIGEDKDSTILVYDKYATSGSFNPSTLI